MKLSTIARILIASIIIGMLGASPIAAADPAAAEPVIMSFGTAELQAATNTTAHTIASTGDGSGWVYSAADGEKAVRLVYYASEKYSPYCFMPKFSGKIPVTSEHKYVRLVFMTTDTGNHSLTLKNNTTGEAVTLAENTAVSGGKWYATAPVDITEGGLLQRYLSGYQNAIEFSGMHEGANVYLKEMAFFTSLEQAEAYYSNTKSASASNANYFDTAAPTSDYVLWDFGAGDVAQTGIVENFHPNCKYDYTTEDGVGCTRIGNYSATKCALYFYATEASRAQFGDGPYYSAITFKTNNSGRLQIRLVNYGEGGTTAAVYTDSTVASDEWVTLVYGSNTEPLALGSELVNCIKTGVHNGEKQRIQITWNNSAWTESTNLEFLVKEMVFFTNAEDAKAYAAAAPEYYNSDDWSKNLMDITIGKNPIENYRVVIPADASGMISESAETLASALRRLSGKRVVVVTDDTEPKEYEILIGNTNRSESQYFYGGSGVYSAANFENLDLTKYSIKMIGNKLVFASPLSITLAYAVDSFRETYVYNEQSDKIAISSLFALDGTAPKTTLTAGKNNTNTSTHTNVTAPTVFTEDFTVDNGYFTEEAGVENWKYENGAYTVKADDELLLSYIHVYEHNAAFEADFTYSDKRSDGEMGITLRYTAPEGYIRAGYDFAEGVWYIDTREGYDFPRYRVATAPATLTAGTVYRLAATVDGSTVALSVNGTEVLRTDDITHITPGRVGVYAKDADVAVDNVKLTMLSGEGTILRNVVHDIIGPGRPLEGGTVLEKQDGTLIYMQYNGLTYMQNSDGTSWVEKSKWTTLKGKPSIMRLNNGYILKVVEKTVDGVKYMGSAYSTDDGATWNEEGGLICPVALDGTGWEVSNMNDKLSQVSSGRIFMSCTYEGGDTSKWLNFVIFYYSDDNGVTWHKSLDTRYIEGNNVDTNELAVYFAEAKIIQCADGRIRMLCSWNNYGCFAYCDSFDNGETWGTLGLIEDYICCRSSFAIARDMAADNDTTYYMVWCYDIPRDTPTALPRTRLALAKTTDGINWEYIGDLWRWESAHEVGSKLGSTSTDINHIIDPSITVTEDSVIILTGASEYCEGSHTHFHNGQQQHIWIVEKDTLPEGKTLNKFTDVNVGASYNDAVSFAVENNLFQGMSATTFEPNTVMNREMFVTVLGRLEGIDITKYTGVSFTDVVKDSWYAPYVDWASTNGVVSGMGDGTYGIGADITVQQACLMLYRYANGKTAATSTGVSISDFADAADAADWAKEGVEWALENGIYAGQNGKLTPTAPASRALVATMFYNYVTVLGK